MEDSLELEDKKSSDIGTAEISELRSVGGCENIADSVEEVSILSLDKVTIEKIVLEGDDGSKEVLLRRTESFKKLSSSVEREIKSSVCPKVENSENFQSRDENGIKSVKITSKGSGINGNANSKAKFNAANAVQKNSQLPVLKAKKSGSVSSLIEKRISPIKLTKSSSITTINKEIKNPKLFSPAKLSKVPPKVPAKPKVKKQASTISYKPSSGSSSALNSTSTKVSDLPSNSNDFNSKNKVRTEKHSSEISTTIRDAPKSVISKKPEVSRLFKPRSVLGVESTLSQRPKSLGEVGKEIVEAAEIKAANFAARNQLRRSQSKIEELQRDLRTKINASTAETYKQRLPGSQSSGVKTRLVKSLDLNENVTREKFDTEFLKKHNFDKQLKIEEKRVLETDLDYVSDTEKTENRSDIPKEANCRVDKLKYSKTVSDIEKRWSGEFLDGQLDHNSSESSKSSYVEELGSISSHEDVIADSNAKFIEEIRKRSEKQSAGNKKSSVTSNLDELLEDTISTVGSNSCVDDRIEDIDDEVDAVVSKNEGSNESKDSTLKESSSSTITDQSSIPNYTRTSEKLVISKNEDLESLNNIKNNNIHRSNVIKSVDVDNNNVETNATSEVNESVVDVSEKDVETRLQQAAVEFRDPDRPISDKDGYADLIKTFTIMEAGTSKSPKEEKKRKGFRRLLPGLFSPKDSRKEYKKEQKERKKREEKHFGQYQQNGNYTRSPDTMNLNEDIKRNVKLNTSLNSSIIEERLNEIKQELFPEQGLTTSTPDHFLQAERIAMRPNSRNQRFYTANSSLSSIAPEDKWMNQNIISGSPDMRNLKQRKPDIDSKRSLERKHSLQEPQGRFFRNHGPSGRTSAPPSERFLIRPRAVHPVDRPLPAIPQKVEFSNYENHHEMQEYPRESFARQALDYQENGGRIYDDRNNLEKSKQNRNHSIDSGFNLTPVSAQVKITRQPVINQNQKAPLLGRSPKYSPCSSQKSGDYADSSYTPNSSQKSEFSPSSSKSGEYYLNSPRTSVQTSPNDSLTDKREQIYENNRQSPKIPYPISPNVKIQNRIDPVYDISSPDRARSPATYDEPPTTPRNFKAGSLTVLPLHPARDTPEPIYVQRNSPHIPLKANPSKLSAHADGTTLVQENYESDVNSPLRSIENSPRNRTVSPVQNYSPASPRHHPNRCQRPAVSPAQRLASPLTVLPLDNSTSGASQNSSVVQMRTSVSPLARPMSPGDGTPTRVIDQLRTPTTSPGMNETRQRSPVSGPYVPMASRRSQPSEQILIASPKRDAFYEQQVRRPTNTRMTEYSASPIPMTDSPNIVIQPPGSPGTVVESVYDTSGGRTTSPKSVPGESLKVNQIRTGNQLSVGIQRPEPIYGQRTQEYDYKQRALSPSRDQAIYNDGDRGRGAVSSSRNPTVRASISPSENPREDTPIQRSAPRTQQPNLSESQQSIYSTRQTPNQEAIYGQGVGRQPSPSKRQTMQHLEAFYWQQKALESQRKSNSSPSTTTATSRQNETRIDHPEIREAMYWQQLKKLDEEQQRRIYQQNLTEERNDPLYWRRKLQSPRTSPTSSNVPSSSPTIRTSPETTENIYWRSKLQQPKPTPINKPPIMGQKGQNQPVLVVRPQPVYQEKEFDNREIYSGQQETAKRDQPPRSKSASPLFARGDERRSLSLPRKVETDDGGFLRGTRERSSIAALRKAETPPIYEEDTDQSDKKPPPIFKRGSLISNSSNSVDYGTGQKRVSFSNQTTKADIGTGIWPTKHGMAPEPPTRQHRADRVSTTSESDSVFLHDVENQNNSNANVYGNVLARSVSQTDSPSTTNTCDYDADRPLPPPPREPLRFLRRSNSVRDQPKGNTAVTKANNPRKWPNVSESESGSEAGEIQRILRRRTEEEWNPDGKGRQSNDTGGTGRGEGEGGTGDLPGGGGSRRVGVAGVGGGVARGTSGGGGRSRDEPRRHTLSGDHQPSLHHQQFNSQLHPLHPHHLPPPHGRYANPSNRHATTMDLESPLPRGYPPPSTAMLFDDDPGIMSEVETSSTGFRRGGKQRSSLPVVRTPSKTLERPLGLVFLQYRNETKRALLPNEITSIDTVKALFVRSFPKQLTMEYLDSPLVKVYIHDSNKDMFYELEDMRSHLRDIRDRSVLRLFESSDGVAGMPGPLGAPGGGGGLPPHWEDQSYFSEPEFDSEYQHQHIHKSKSAKNSTSGNGGYYMGGSSTLPRGGPLLRAYSPATSSAVSGQNANSTQSKTLGTPDRLHGESGYMSSPERSGGVGAGTGRYPSGPYSTGSSYEDPYYSQYSGTVTPVIDEEARIRVEHMERQLANLTGLVQKALTHAPHASPSPRDYLQVPAPRDPYRTADKSVSFEKSVSFSDEPPDMNSPKQHSPQHADRERHKPTPPPKPATLAAGQYVYRDLTLTPEMYNQLRGLQKKAKDLGQEVKNLRRMSQAQAHTVRETIRDTFIMFRAVLLSGGDAAWAAGDTEKVRLNREEDLYKQEMIRLEKDLTELESTVEELRGNVINRKTRVNMSDVENMALILNKSSKTVADLKTRFPNLQEGMKGLLSSEMEKVVREEKFLKEEPERLESALRRCKKLTGTLVTLKRLASVQEQRLPNAASVEAEDTPPITPTSGHSKTTGPASAERTVMGSASLIGGGSHPHDTSTPYQQRPENALDALLDELQTFSRPASQLSQTSSISYNNQGNSNEIVRSGNQQSQISHTPSMSDIGRKGSIDSSTNLAIQTTTGHTSTLRRLHSYPSSSDTDTSPPIARLQVSENATPPQKPPVPERNAELLQLATARRVPPPPPPRTSSRSPLASPTSPQLPPRNPTGTLRRGRGNLKESGKPPMALPPNANQPEDQQQLTITAGNNILSASNSSSCESINSQEGLQNKKGRQEQLEQRHQELLRKQKALQEQYARLQQLQRNASGLTTVPPAPPDLLKKTGSESNLLAKMGLGLSTASSGSLTSLATRPELSTVTPASNNTSGNQTTTTTTTTSKIYETDIL